MRLLTRYVLLEFAKVFFTALIAMTTLLLLVGVVKQAISEGLGVAQVMQLMPYILPDALRVTVPGTVLFATCVVYGRMSGSNEVVVLKSLGISPGVIFWPVMILAFLLSLATVKLNDVAVSWGRAGVRRVVLEAIDEIAYSMLRVHRSYGNDKVSINVKNVEGRRLILPTISIATSSMGRGCTIRAQEAELRADPEKDVLILDCLEAVVEVDGAARARLPRFAPEIPLHDAKANVDNSWAPSWMALAKIADEVVAQEKRIEAKRQEMVAKSAFALLSGDFDYVINREWNTDTTVIVQLREILHRLLTEPQRRWSNGFSCLFFALVGAPMAVRLRNSDVLQVFFLCFLPILLVYYPLMAWSVDHAKTGSIPAWSVWGGNVAIALWGLFLLRRVFRY